MKIRKDIFDYIYFGIIGIFLILFLTGQFTSLTGTQLVVIENPDPNSMFPTYFQGDLFVINKGDPAEIYLGDVIVYNGMNGGRIIHRVIDIEITDGDYFFRVKGDDPVTNGRPDPHLGGTLVPFDDVLGKVVKRIAFMGHVSLAIQNNPAVQIFVYLIGGIMIIAIMFWPDEEEEDEDTHYDVTRETISQHLREIKALGIKFIGAFTTSKHKLLTWSLLVMLIMMSILPIFVPVFLPMSMDVERGVQEVELDPAMFFMENVIDDNITFYNVFITMFDDGNLFNFIESYTMKVYHGSEVVDDSKWNTLRPIKGEFTVGGSITIDQSVSDTFPPDTQLTIEIVVEVNELFGYSQLDPYTHTFTFN